MIASPELMKKTEELISKPKNFIFFRARVSKEKFLKFVFIKYPNYLCKPHLFLQADPHLKHQAVALDIGHKASIFPYRLY